MYVQSGTDDGGFASRGLALLGDSAAVMPESEFVEDPPTLRRPSDVMTIRRGSMTSVPAVSPYLYTDTRSPSRVHTLSVSTLLAPGAEYLAALAVAA